MPNEIVLILLGVSVGILVSIVLCLPVVNVPSPLFRSRLDGLFLRLPLNPKWKDGEPQWTPLHSSLRNAKLNWYLYEYDSSDDISRRNSLRSRSRDYVHYMA